MAVHESREPVPTELLLRKRSRELVVSFTDGACFVLGAEYLRVHSPSAEVKGHGGGEGALVTGKEQVNLERVEPVGRYAVRLVFDDGHASGLFTWPILYELGEAREKNWRRYLERLRQAGIERGARHSE
jgi:DUF971 family protein